MILYHGSNVKIDEIDLNKCNKFKDFGQGFYCTSIRQQAELLLWQVNDSLATVAEIVNKLKYKELTDQYSFHTEKALKYLKGV